MTDQEIIELPKVWVVGGDGGMGDIGYQNMSKVILQNRPNIKVLMLDTQVYSNTGGQNSDSTPTLGGGDMNTFGAATQGKNTEKKTVAETFACRPRFALRRPGFYGQRPQALPRNFGRIGVSRHLGDPRPSPPASRVRRSRRHGSFSGSASPRGPVAHRSSFSRSRKGETYQELRPQRQPFHRSRLVRNQKEGNRRANSALTVAHWCTMKPASAITCRRLAEGDGQADPVQ